MSLKEKNLVTVYTCAHRMSISLHGFVTLCIVHVIIISKTLTV